MVHERAHVIEPDFASCTSSYFFLIFNTAGRRYNRSLCLFPFSFDIPKIILNLFKSVV